MAKVAIKSEKLSPFGGIFSIMEQFDSKLSSVIDSTLDFLNIRHWQDLRLQHGRQAEYTASQLPIVCLSAVKRSTSKMLSSSSP